MSRLCAMLRFRSPWSVGFLTVLFLRLVSLDLGQCAFEVLGKNCTSDRECMLNKFEDKLVYCSENQNCSCNPAKTTFDPDTGRCRILAGESCEGFSHTDCVKNAGHVVVYHKLQCICDRGYHRTKDRLCSPDHGTACTRDKPCGNEFSCIEGKCECIFPFHQYYNNSGSGHCISYARGPCHEEVDGVLRKFPCVPNAECSNSSGLPEGYIEVNRTCLGTFGQNCEGQGQCDSIGGLECQNGRCTCPDFRIYDNEKGSCLIKGRVGSLCSIQQKSEFCGERAFCEQLRFPDPASRKGVCTCKRNFKSTLCRTCE